ncbi:MAG: carbohydrate ABC transporter permease [Spirochaetales bacterium]|nr:carbohydrate ABC transporter permease [Spirochaetales bacterium]
MLSFRSEQRLNRIVTHFILVLSSLVIIFPFFWMISTSFKPDAEILRIPPTLLPVRWNTGFYQELLQDTVFLRFFLNSLIVASTGTVLSTFNSLIAGFVFAKFRFRGRELLFFLILLTIMVPFQCYMIPLYVLAVRYSLVDTYAGLIFPIIVSSFGIFFMRQNIQTIPDSLLEAAKIDGASVWGTFFRIITPLSVSAIVILAIFQFMTAWGDFIWPLIITNSRRMFVLELGLSQFIGEFSVDYGMIMAGAFVAILPVVTVFLVFRRYVIEGMTLSGIKG